MGAPADFWTEFSMDGRRMSYTAICALLTTERNDDAATVAKKARIDYGDDFGNHFSYRKGPNRFIVLKDDIAIAKKAAFLKKNGTYRTSK